MRETYHNPGEPCGNRHILRFFLKINESKMVKFFHACNNTSQRTANAKRACV